MPYLQRLMEEKGDMAYLNLCVQLEGGIEKTVSVDKEEFVIGRLPECDLQLAFSQISRYHARLFKAEGVWLVEDMGSTNGTSLNEQSITSPQRLNDGDTVQLGPVSISINIIEITESHPINKVVKPQQSTVVLSSEEMTIFSAEDLQKQWIQPNEDGDNTLNQDKAIARLKDLVDIAKALNSVVSIEGIFSQVQEVVFRNLKTIERLALLVDVHSSGKLELLNAAARNVFLQKTLEADDTWISRSICQKAYTDKVAIKTADAQLDERFEGEHSILAKGIRSALAVPLWDENKVFGVLYADANLSFNNWTKGGDEDLSFFSALGNLVASSVQRWLLTRKLRSEESIRHRLERYHSPTVVQHIMKVGALSDGRLVPVERDISIMFADIVGFTALSQKLSAATIADLLNVFFEEMLKEVFAVGGTLDKFIGDCIMAFFGAPEPQADHPDRAVAAAKGMLKRLALFNSRYSTSHPLQLRIAINSGKAVVGDVGSPQRVDYTALGATINLASRMETICPPGVCVISEATYKLLRQPQTFEPFGQYNFKGIEHPVQVYKNKQS